MKRSILLLIGIYFITLISVTAQSKPEDADKAIKKKDYSTALNIAKEFLNRDSANVSLKILIELRENMSPNKLLFEYLGDAYAKMNVAELALENYGQAESMDSTDVTILTKTADLLYKQRRYKEAVNKYLKIVSIDPKNTKAYLDAATILYAGKLYADAAIMFEKYLTLDKSKEAYEKITSAYNTIKSFDKSYSYATEGLAKYPDDILLKKNAGIAAYYLMKFDEAAKYYNAVPDSLLSINDLKNAGTSFSTIKSDSIAILYFEKVIKKDSTQSSLFMDIANSYFRNKENEKAIKYYAAKIKVDPKYEPAYRYMGFAYFIDGKFNDARQAFLDAKNLNDTTFTTNYYLAQCYTRVDSSEQAAEQYVRVLKLAAGKEKQYKDAIYEASDFLGLRAYQRKNYSGAISNYSKALQVKPNEWRIMEMLGVCNFLLQNNDEAIKWYRATLKYNPNSDVAKKGLRRLSAD
jgi:tetratricopeptide (TPR) repeat protein